MSRRAPRLRLVVDPISCDGHGHCAELLPEGIRLDDWGYPMLAPGAVPDHLVDLARRAVRDCPALALKLVPVDNPTGTDGSVTAPPPRRRGAPL